MNPISNLSQSSRYPDRQNKLIRSISRAGIDCLILNPGPSLVYFTGLHFHLSERPVVVFFTPDRAPVIVLPELEQEKLKHLPYNIQAIPYGEDPSKWIKAFQKD